MALSTDQILLYGGAVLAAVSLLWLAGSLLHFHRASRCLNRHLDEEYGKPVRRNG